MTVQRRSIIELGTSPSTRASRSLDNGQGMPESSLRSGTRRLPMSSLPRPVLLVLCMILLLFSTTHAKTLERRQKDVFRSSERNLLSERTSIVQSNPPVLHARDFSGALVSGPLRISPSPMKERSVKTPRTWSMPRAFDTSLGSNFTTPSCPLFFKQFLSDPKFQSCAAVSTMLQTSASFFEDTKSKTTMNKVLGIACAAPAAPCVNLISSYADEILKSDACLDDYNAQNPLVVQAYAGLVSYKVVREATCLEDIDSNAKGDFCFSEAVTNVSSPTSSYIYYLPLGVNLPAGAMPTCNSCLQKTMGVFASYATDPVQPLSLTYPEAATSVNIICGPEFVQSHIKVIGAASGTFYSRPTTWLMALLTILFLLT